MRQVPEVGVVEVSPVKDHDLTGLDPGADFAGAGAVVLLGHVDDGEGGQEALQVEPQMALGRRLAPPVFGPVHTAGDEFDGGGVDHMDGAAKAVGQPLAPAPITKGGHEALQMLQRLPEELLGQFGVALPAGMGEPIAAGRRGATNGRERATVEPQGIADIIEPDGVRKLCEEQRDDLTPGGEGAALFFQAQAAHQLRHKVVGNQIAKLPENRELGDGWTGGVRFFHTLPRGSSDTPVHPFLHQIPQLWDGCDTE